MATLLQLLVGLRNPKVYRWPKLVGDWEFGYIAFEIS
jgi:hypothetical protein